MDTDQESYSKLYDVIYGQKASYDTRIKVTTDIAQTINQIDNLVSIGLPKPDENKSFVEEILKSVFWTW